MAGEWHGHSMLCVNRPLIGYHYWIVRQRYASNVDQAIPV